MDASAREDLELLKLRSELVLKETFSLLERFCRVCFLTDDVVCKVSEGRLKVTEEPVVTAPGSEVEILMPLRDISSDLKPLC